MPVLKNVFAWLRRGEACLAPTLLHALCALLLLAPLAAGCSRQGLAQAATATVEVAATPTVAATSAPTSSETTPEATPSNVGTEVAGTPEGTPTIRPTPVGPTPTDPMNVLNIFELFPSVQNLVKRDSLQLDGDDTPEVLFTVVEPGETITEETSSALRVLDYDPAYREWKAIWLSDVITGTASPLPAFETADPNRANAYNGRDLLNSGSPAFLARTTTLDGRAHLYMWLWDRDKRAATPLKMVTDDGSERTLDISGDLDVKVADLNNDLVYEVVAENLTGVDVWAWDGTRYALRGGR